MTTDTIASTSTELLANVEKIWRENEATRDPGERFNLLTIIRRGHLEVMTHSPILAELLRPHGSHGEKEGFLRLFLNRIGILDFDATTATVHEEVCKGVLGRIDLVISDARGRQIFIENKIGAGLQDRQLERYQEANRNAHLLFLTLDGSPPSLPSEKIKEVPGLKLLSYRHDIVDWLVDCESAAQSSTVRHAIERYRRLVVELSGRILHTKMNGKITAAVLQNANSFSAFAAMVDAKREIYQSLSERLVRGVSLKAPAAFIPEMNGVGAPYKDGWRMPLALQDGVLVHAEFSFESSNFENCYYGFRLQSGSLNEASRGRLAALFQDVFKITPIPNQQWPSWAYWEIKSWDAAIWSKVLTDDLNEFADRISRTLKQLEVVAVAFAERESRNPTALS